MAPASRWAVSGSPSWPGNAERPGRGPRLPARRELRMPKLTLMLDRKTVQVYDLDRPVIRVGRVPEMDIVIDNVSVSRRQAEIQQEGEGWVVRDIGSSNGTFATAERLSGGQARPPA